MKPHPTCDRARDTASDAWPSPNAETGSSRGLPSESTRDANDWASIHRHRFGHRTSAPSKGGTASHSNPGGMTSDSELLLCHCIGVFGDAVALCFSSRFEEKSTVAPKTPMQWHKRREEDVSFLGTALPDPLAFGACNDFIDCMALVKVLRWMSPFRNRLLPPGFGRC